jgi:hypothetical protein
VRGTGQSKGLEGEEKLKAFSKDRETLRGSRVEGSSVELVVTSDKGRNNRSE